jgi:Tol biopolymer transport system component
MAEGQEAQLAYDGRYLALVRSRGQDQTLHARDPKTRREILLCDTPGQLIRNATWSPDGKWIAYLSRPHEQLQWELWVCRLSSDPTPTRLVEAVRVDEDFRHVGPAWSPDGDKLWFLRAEGNQGYYPIQWISRDGHRQGTIEYPRGVTTALDLAVGPDARRPALAFSAVRQHAVDVFVLLLNHY